MRRECGPALERQAVSIHSLSLRAGILKEPSTWPVLAANVYASTKAAPETVFQRSTARPLLIMIGRPEHRPAWPADPHTAFERALDLDSICLPQPAAGNGPRAISTLHPQLEKLRDTV